MSKPASSSGPVFAGLWPRTLGLALDFVVFCAVFFPITRVVKGTWLLGPTDHRWNSGLFVTDPLCLVFLLVMVLYFIGLEGTVGATLGKLIVGTRVVTLDGHRPGLARSTVRNLMRLVDGLPAFSLLGAYLIWRSEERTRLGDRVAGTRVVHARQPVSRGRSRG